VFFALIKRLLKEKPKGYFAEIAKTSKASRKRPPRACIVFTRWRRRARSCSGDQRQRQRNEIEVRHLYGCRESLVDGIRRGTDVMMSGKVAMVAGFGDVGKGSAASLRQAGCRVHGLGSRSDLRVAGGDGRLRGRHDGRRRSARRHLRHRTGNKDIITIEHMRAMKDRAIVCNIGHFDNEIQIAHLRNLKWTNIKPQVDEITFADGKRMILLSEGAW